MYFILDMFVSPNLHSCFFLNVLNSKNFYYILFIGLVLDFIFFSTAGGITLLLIILYFIDKRLKNFYLKNIINFIIFYFIIYSFSYINFFLDFLFYLLFIVFMKKAYY